MAKKWTDEEKKETAAFVTMLYGLAPVRTQAELAAIAGVHPVQVSRWMTASDMPEGYNLVRLLKASGAMALLQDAADHKARGVPDVRPRALVDALTELQKQVASMMEVLAALEARSDTYPSRGNGPKSQRGGRQ